MSRSLRRPSISGSTKEVSFYPGWATQEIVFLGFDGVASRLLHCRAHDMGGDNLLMVADSDHDANMLYAVGMFVPDPFVYLRLNGKCHIALSDLEVDRARKQAPHCRVIALSHCYRNLRKEGGKKFAVAHAIRRLLRQMRIKKVTSR